MASQLFTRLSPAHFDAAEAGGYADAIGGYGIDAEDWIPRGSCQDRDGPDATSVMRPDPKSHRARLAALLAAR